MINVARLKNKERGRRAFILANGPSLLTHDLSRLKNELVIGLNGATLVQKQFGFPMPYYALTDQRFVDNPEKWPLASDQLPADTLRVIRQDLVEPATQVALDSRTIRIRALGRDGFSDNLAKGFYFGCSTTVLAVQLAAYLGVSAIHILGLDLTYPKDMPRFYGEDKPEIEDAFASVQIRNLLLASEQLARRCVPLTISSVASLARVYLPYTPYEAFWDKQGDFR